MTYREFQVSMCYWSIWRSAEEYYYGDVAAYPQFVSSVCEDLKEEGVTSGRLEIAREIWRRLPGRQAGRLQ